MSYRAVVPTFEAIQWTGSNQAVVEAFMDPYLGETAVYSVESSPDPEVNGLLRAQWNTYNNVYVPLNHYLVHGPRYGSYTASAGFFARSASAFAVEYEVVA